MNRDPEGIAPIFAQHRRTPLKKLLTSDEAHRLTVRLNEIGVDTLVENLAPKPALETSQEEPAHPAAKAICPKCGHLMEKLAHACPACGVVFSKLAHARSDDRNGHGRRAKFAGDKGPALTEAVGDYIGPDAHNYLQTFRRFGTLADGSFASTWHWPAFFFGFLWALYRKLWLWGGFLLIGGTYTAYLAPPAAVFLWLTWALSANYVYYHHTTRRTRQIIDRHGQRATPHLVSEGGTSRIAVAGGIIALAAFPIVFQDVLLKQISDLVGQSVVVHMGTAQDSHPLGPEALSDVKITAAAVQMNLLVRDIESWRKTHPGEIANASLGDIAREGRWKDSRLADPWGNLYRLSRAGSALELVSSGSDHRLDTTDDLRLQIP
jgi:hypothetical protein